MSLFLKRTSAFVFSLLLVACGGGGGGSDGGATSSGNGPQSSGDPPSSGSGDGGAPSSPSGGTGGGSSSPPPEFSANVLQAPADGTTLAGTVALEIRGSGIANAELLIDTGYAPVLERFTVSADRTVARLNFDTRNIPNGLLRLRISAFNMPPGSSEASEIVAMPARSWTFNNSPPPDGTPAGRAAKCTQRGLPYTDMDDSQPVVCIDAVPLSPQLDYEQCVASGYQFGTGYTNPSDALPVVRDGRRISKLYCIPPALNGSVSPGCVCLASQ
jgi:hypothetical protein